MIERKDKIKNQAKVIKELAKDPTLTEREVARNTGLSNGGVHGHIKEIKQKGAGSNIMDRILEMDDEIIDLANKLHLRDIREKFDNGESLTLQDQKLIGDLANNSTKRKAIFGDKTKGDDKIQFIIS